MTSLVCPVVAPSCDVTGVPGRDRGAALHALRRNDQGAHTRHPRRRPAAVRASCARHLVCSDPVARSLPPRLIARWCAGGAMGWRSELSPVHVAAGHKRHALLLGHPPCPNSPVQHSGTRCGAVACRPAALLGVCLPKPSRVVDQLRPQNRATPVHARLHRQQQCRGEPARAALRLSRQGRRSSGGRWRLRGRRGGHRRRLPRARAP